MNNLIYKEFNIADTCFKLREELFFLKSSIIESLYILDLKDNWDSEGSIGYLQSTWEYSISFLIYLYEKILNDYRITLNAPLIFHGKKWRNRFFIRELYS